MILIIRCNNIIFDPRVEKYVTFLDQKNIKYHILGWDRLNENLSLNNCTLFSLKSTFGNGGIKAVFHRFKWIIFVIKFLLKRRNQFHIIHACDLDSAFPACLFKFIFYRKVKIIFDVFDWFSATLYKEGWFIRRVFYWMEKFSIQNSNEVIICEPERIRQIPFKLNHKELVLPNIPSFTDFSFLQYDKKFSFENNNIIVSYVGGFAGERMLEELLNVAEKGIINLLIAGFGTRIFEQRCELLSSLSNVKYFGKVEYKTGLNIMFNSEIIYAMYPRTNPNNLYAAPNKYYEAMLLGKPIISTKGISLASKITNNGIGYVIDELESDLIYLIKNLDRENMKQKGITALSLWNNKYSTYISNFLNKDYISLLNGELHNYN